MTTLCKRKKICGILSWAFITFVNARIMFKGREMSFRRDCRGHIKIFLFLRALTMLNTVVLWDYDPSLNSSDYGMEVFLCKTYVACCCCARNVITDAQRKISLLSQMLVINQCLVCMCTHSITWTLKTLMLLSYSIECLWLKHAKQEASLETECDYFVVGVITLSDSSYLIYPVVWLTVGAPL